MNILVNRRLGAALAGSIAGLAPVTDSLAATLAEFDFNDALGAFEAQPEFQHETLASAQFSDLLGTLTDFAGNPGRSLAASGFSNGNEVRLTLAAAAAKRITLDRIAFDLRVSASGPQQWQLALNGTPIADGSTTTQFSNVSVPLTAAFAAPTLAIDFRGFDASDARGTLRLDNVVVEGSISAVPLPAPLSLALAALASLFGWRARAPHSARNGHSRQASIKGKYRPSMIGRSSIAAMMRA